MITNTRIVKFNNSVGAILCNNCNGIVLKGFEDVSYMVARKKQLMNTIPPLISKQDCDSKEPLYCQYYIKEQKKIYE